MIRICFFLFLIGFFLTGHAGEKAVNFSAFSVSEDKKVDLPANIDLAGNRAPSVLLFWATWCSACKTQMRLLQQEIIKGNILPGRIFAVSLGENLKKIENYAQGTDFMFQFFAMPDTQTIPGYVIEGTPVMYLITKENEIAGVYKGNSVEGIKAIVELFATKN